LLKLFLAQHVSTRRTTTLNFSYLLRKFKIFDEKKELMNIAAKGVLAFTLGIAMGIPCSVRGWADVSYEATQDTQPAAKPASRLIGTVTSVQGNTITVKTDAGTLATLTINEQTRILRTAPGQKDLSGATAIHVEDIQIDDRLLSRVTGSESDKSYVASMVIAMKQADIAQKQREDRDAWQRGGIGGLVQGVDASAQTVTVTVHQTGLLVVHLTPSTILRRYAPDSIKFDDAKPAPFSAIKAGDQLRARGTQNPDTKEFTAVEIVSGTFHNIAATVSSIDLAANTLTLTDLSTKKPVSLHVTSDSQLHKLPPEMAQALAARLKGGARGAAGQDNKTPANAPSGGDHPAGAAANPDNAQEQGSTHRGPGDPQQMLARTPTVSLSDLKKGDALMIVATEGSSTNPATVVMLVAGVEPMFQASTSATQNMLSSWSLNSGGADGQ
jgi:transcription antitermination factor NusG